MNLAVWAFTSFDNQGYIVSSYITPGSIEQLCGATMQFEATSNILQISFEVGQLLLCVSTSQENIPFVAN